MNKPEENVFDWAGLMTVGMETLGLDPNTFWSLTPFELALMSGSISSQNARFSRSDLERLCVQFPDKITEK